MLSDFLLLESYYEGPETTRFYEDLMNEYGLSSIRKALRAGHICCHCLRCGPEKGRWLFRLTSEGRRKAQITS